jgi:hypothetical protein
LLIDREVFPFLWLEKGAGFPFAGEVRWLFFGLGAALWELPLLRLGASGGEVFLWRLKKSAVLGS